VALVIQCERKHAPQPVYAIRTQILVQVNNHFRIGVGIKAVATFFQDRRAALENCRFPPLKTIQMVCLR